MDVLFFVDGRRQRGIHEWIPHNWSGEVAENYPLAAGEEGRHEGGGSDPLGIDRDGTDV